MVELVRAGRSPEELAREFEPTAQSIRNWVGCDSSKQDAREEKGLVAGDHDELVRLRREVRQLRQERDILSKAAAWFARETGTLPSGSSGS
jgi:transposase